jgi:hypothetical protein
MVAMQAAGVLLLAVFPLPEPEVVADEGVQDLSVTLEGGQTVALTIALSEGGGGEERAYVIQLAYVEHATVETPGAAVPLAPPRPETST